MANDRTTQLRQHYPWAKSPLVASAPMRLIARAKLAAAVTQAGGLGFIAGGTDTSLLNSDLEEVATLLGHKATATDDASSSQDAADAPVLPVGVGFINWSADLETAVAAIARWRPVAAWFFAPRATADLVTWATRIRAVSPRTEIWVQLGTVHEAVAVTQEVRPDVLVLQGSDAGGHLLSSCASLITLLPEAKDALESLARQSNGSVHVPYLIGAGGIADARGVVAALALGADGVVMGTRYLASQEAIIAKGYQQALLDSSDGGVTTVTSRVYDRLRGTDGWPAPYGARGVINASYHDAMAGLDEEENKKQYEKALKLGDDGWGPQGRLTAYAGTAVGLLHKTQPAGEITAEVINASKEILNNVKAQLG